MISWNLRREYGDDAAPMSFDDFDTLLSSHGHDVVASEAVVAPSLLIIDDDPSILDSLSLALRDSYTVVTASSGKDGLDKFDRHFHAVVLDVKMRDMNGFETFTGLKEKDSDIPIIFHSAYQDFKDPLTVLNEFRPFGYVIKGAATSILQDLLASAVKLHIKTTENNAMRAQLERDKLELEKRVAERTRELEDTLQEITQLSRTDHLTKIANRRYFFKCLSSEADRSKRYSRPLSLMIMDLDNFKEINDTFGHAEGDNALCVFSEILERECRESDLVGRIGGDEFAVLLVEANESEAQVVASRILAAVKNCEVHRVDGQGCLEIGVSIGCHVSFGGDDNPAMIYEKADAAMYTSKKQGKNKITINV